MLVCFFACDKDDDTNPDDKEVNNNGVLISYVNEGKGKPTLLFVHGWCGSLNYWTAQIEAFKTNYNVVAVDLPGYGNLVTIE